VTKIFGRDSNWVSTCRVLRWVAPYSGRSIGFQFGDVDHSNGGDGPRVVNVADRDFSSQFL
jgi:hypothetical protein